MSHGAEPARPEIADADATLGETLRARVVVREPIDVMVERVEHRRRRDARLTERAAEQELPLPRPLDELGRAREHGAEGTAEPFREADRDRVRERGPRRDRL